MASAIRSCVRAVKQIFDHESFYHLYCSSERSSLRFRFHTSTLYNVKGTNIRMPSLSPTMTSGTIVKWYKKEGDVISPGDVLCDIQTDKAVMSFEIEEEGVLAKVLVPEGTTDVHVGTLIGLIVDEGEDWNNIEIPKDKETSVGMTNVSDVPDDSDLSVHKVAMPSLSPTMTEGTIVKWHKKEGDLVIPGDILCDIQTDKAVMGFEVEEEGILAKILIEEGTSGVKVGSLLAVMVPEGAEWKNVRIPSLNSSLPEKCDVKEAEPKSKGIISNFESQRSGSYGPAVRILLELYRIDGSQVSPTGKNKKLLKSDVLKYIAVNKLQPKPLNEVPLSKTRIPEVVASTTIIPRDKTVQKYSDIELSSMRKTIASRLIMSKRTIPHAYATVSCRIDELLSLRKQMKSAGIAVSVNDFFVKAVALALFQCPHMNKLYLNGEVVAISNIDISIAVATKSGLITPIIKKADGKSVSEISIETKELAQKARQGKLQLHEFQGGSFTISNLGMFSISEFSAIINPPQCAILAVGGGLTFIDANRRICTNVTSTLSYDSRVISESAAADFLETLQWLLHNPVNIIIGLPKEIKKVYAHN